MDDKILPEKTAQMEKSAEAEQPPIMISKRSFAFRQRLVQFSLLLTIVVSLSLAIAAYFNKYFSWDIVISHGIQAISLPGFASLMYLISIPGNNAILPILLVIAVMLLLFRANLRTEAYSLLLSAGGGQLFNTLIKFIIHRPRPSAEVIRVSVIEITYSFPSGHVMHYICFYGFLFFLTFVLMKRSIVRTMLLIIFGLLVTLAGISRIYLGAHWPSDVTAAYLMGMLWLTLSISYYRRKVIKEKSL